MLLLLLNFSDDFIRWSNFVLAFLSLAAITGNMTARREHINRRTRRIMLWVYGLFLYTAYIAGAAVRNDDPVNHATYFGLFVFVGLLVSVLWHPEGDHHKPPNDGSAGQWFLDRMARAYDSVMSSRNNDKNQTG